MIRVLFISSEYPPETGFGGIGTYTKYAAEGLAALGHKVTVVCRSLTEEKSERRIGDVQVFRIPPAGYRLPRGKLMYPLRMLSYRLIHATLNRLAWARTAWEQYLQLKAQGNDFDIIEYPECGAEGYYFSKSKDAARIVRLHTPWEIIRQLDGIKEPFMDRWFESRCERNTIRYAHGISAPSKAMFHLLKNKWKIHSVEVYPNPIDASRFPQASGERWMYTGRVERRKGVHILLRAYARLTESSVAPSLLLVGRPYGELPDGMPYGEHIRSLLSSCAIEDKVTWIEGASHDEIIRLLSGSSAAFFPSLWENFPYSCLEAMACGLAVVASDCGGYPEMIKNGKNGLLFETENAGALTAAMRRLIDNRDLARMLGEAARQSVKSDFDSSHICKQAEAFYTTAMKRMTHG